MFVCCCASFCPISVSMLWTRPEAQHTLNNKKLFLDLRAVFELWHNLFSVPQKSTAPPMLLKTPLFLHQHAHGRTYECKTICYLNNAEHDGEMRQAETSKITCAAPCAALCRVLDRTRRLWLSRVSRLLWTVILEVNKSLCSTKESKDKVDSEEPVIHCNHSIHPQHLVCDIIKRHSFIIS